MGSPRMRVCTGTNDKVESTRILISSISYNRNLIMGTMRVHRISTWGRQVVNEICLETKHGTELVVFTHFGFIRGTYLIYDGVSRRNIRLELQQPGMERRRANSTRYLGFQHRLQWRIDWQFPAAANFMLSDNRRAQIFCTLKDIRETKT